MAQVKESTAQKTQVKPSGTTKSAEPTGQFVWHELATTDPDAAQTFYKKVIGWGTSIFPESDPDKPYVMWMAGDRARGGVMELPEMARKNGAPPHWLTYIGVADTDQVVDRVKALGGKVYHGPETIPNVGRFAVLADPQGAAFAVIAGEGNPPPDREPGPGDFSWHELGTSDADAAWKFYSELFGWRKTEAMDTGDGNIYQMFGFGGPSVGGLSKRTDVPPNWMPYVIVKDIDAAVEQAKSSGGNVVFGPMEVPGGDRVACAVDPQGAMLGLHVPAK